MATKNPFDLLGDDDNDDPSLVVVSSQLQLEKPKKHAPAAQAKTAKPDQLPTKPPPPSQAVKEARTESGRGGGLGGRGYGGGRGRGGGFNRDSNNENNGYSAGLKPSEDGGEGNSERRNYGATRGGFRGGRRGGYTNCDAGDGERSRRVFERRSGTGRGNGFKRDGAGRGNWGNPGDEVAVENEEPVVEAEKTADVEGQRGETDAAADANEDSPPNEPEEREPEEKEMTLQEYEKVLEVKRKALLALKTEERKVDTKVFESMQQLSNKKENDEIFVKLGSEKDKRKEAADKEERAKKSVSINEFLKPADGEKYYNPGGRGRGRGRGSRGGYGGSTPDVVAPSIEDPGQFPNLGGK